MKTLIVEDEFTCRKLLQIYLSEHGQCFTAGNGAEAIEAVEESILEKAPYDLVCMDIMMPEVDGIEAVQKIRQIEEKNGITGLSGVKIIMTTTKGFSEDIFEAFRAGCEAYLVKPILKEELLCELENLGLITTEKASS